MALSWDIHQQGLTESPIYVEEWGPSFGAPYLIPGEEEGSVAKVTLAEDGERLEMHQPGETTSPHKRLAFVDGVRRVEAALYQHDAISGLVARGIAGAAACGCVVSASRDRLEFGEHRVHRLLVWGSGTQGRLPEIPGGWNWRAFSIASSVPDAPLHELQRVMREEEGKLAESIWAEETLVIVDGPLNFIRSRDVPVVGYVKTHYRALLPPDQHLRIPLLGAGQRTSVFSIGEDRYSCYLRLTGGTALSGPWSGIVRLEVPQVVGLAEAIEVADEASRLLPRFAGVPHRDPRAPQNLQPIGALESHLRHLLGDSGLANRAVRQAVAQKTASTPT